jgi:gamma-tubulin complex component 3
MSQSTSAELDEPRPSGIREEETGLTLRRLEVWVDEWRLRMRMMSVCVEGCQGLFVSGMLVGWYID